MAFVTLLTDFGTQDHYVAVMKAVILRIAPQVSLIDVSHDIRPQDITKAAFILRQIINWYPAGTVHLAVVDPGVGSQRRILAGKYAGQFVVCPDNGLISLVHRELRAEGLHVVDNRKYMLPTVSSTFHGRDILSPAAAHLAGGLALRELGPPADRIEVLQLAAPAMAPQGTLQGRVLLTDRFGNLITNITRRDLLPLLQPRRPVQVYVGERCLGPIRAAYHEVPAGDPLALIGSSDHLEIGVNCGDAAAVLGVAPDAVVEVR